MAIIHGDNQIFEDCRLALKTLMDELKTAMDTDSDDPRPAAVYDGHEQMKMSLPAISVDFLGLINDGKARIQGRAAGAGQIVVRYPLLGEIRMHTDYRDGYRDNIKLARLLNSVNNWIETHRDFSADLDSGDVVSFQVTNVTDLTMNDEFPESLTLGGKIRLSLVTIVTHTQA